MPAFHRRRPPIAASCALVALVTAISSPAWADPAPSYAQLLARLDQTPAATEALALEDAAEARVRQARVRPNPTVSLEAENVLGSGPFSGFGGADTTLSVSQDLELFGRRGARIDAARADARTATLRRDLAVVDAAGRLALAYAEAEAAERRAALADETLTLTLADARAALVLVEEGREPLLRGIQGESEAAAARATADEAAAERDAAFARLTAVAQLAAPVTSIPATLLDQTPASAAAAAEGPPTVRVAEAERQAAERRIASNAPGPAPTSPPASGSAASRPRTPRLRLRPQRAVAAVRPQSGQYRRGQGGVSRRRRPARKRPARRPGRPGGGRGPPRRIGQPGARGRRRGDLGRGGLSAIAHRL